MDDRINVAIVDDRPLALAEFEPLLADPGHGAVDWFVGRVRNRNQGRDVLGVSYDVHDALCLNVFQSICSEADERWSDGLRFSLVHYRGRLDVGGVSVIAGVSAPHREEAFQACRYLVEQMKHRAPIWKMEHYVDGDTDWVKGHALCAHG